MKLLGRGLRTGATQAMSGKSLARYAMFALLQITMKTMINHRLVTKSFQPTLYKFIVWAFNVRTQHTNLGSLQIESLQLAPSVGRLVRWHKRW